MDDIIQIQEKPVKTRARRRLYLAGVSLLGVLALNAGVTQLMIRAQRPVTVSFDMKGTLDRFMDQAAQRQLSDAQGAALSARFTRALDDSLRDYRQSHSALILVTPSVVGGAADITAQIQHEIAVRMQNADGEAQ